MENREVVDIIAEAKNKKWFNEKKVEISYPIINEKRTFDSFFEFYFYINKQVELKTKVSKHENVPLELRRINEFYEGVLHNLLFLVSNFSHEKDSELDNHWDTLIKDRLLDLNRLIPLDSDLFDTLLELMDKSFNSFEAAYNYVFQGTILQNNRGLISKDALEGILEVHRIIKGEKFYSNLLEIKSKELKELTYKFETNIANSEVKLADHLAATNNKYKEYTKEIDEFKTDKKSEVNSWFDLTRDGFNAFDNTSKSKIADLEKTYEELLRLKKPADYWKKRSEVLKSEGWLSLKCLILLLLIAGLSLYFLLWQTPEGMLKSFFNEDKATAIKWSIVFITFISLFVFGIRALSKVMFSSFHLSRDAEEREHLTYVYLALIKETSIEKEERLLIMQSLFSRADSGLLKEDSSPTMPGGVLDKIMTK